MNDSARQAGWAMTPGGVTWLSVTVNVLLSVAKVLVGLLCASQTILADGLHSASDLVTDVAVLAGLGVSGRPADPCHPYGHRRISTLVGLFIGAALMGAAAWIVIEAVRSFHRFLHEHPTASLRADWPFWVALGSVLPKEAMYRLTRHVGRRVGDVSLLANAWHHRTDAFTSVAAAVGLGGVVLGGEGWRFLDPLTATVLAAFLMVVAVRLMGASAAELVDRSPGRGELAGIEQAVRGTRGVRSYHAFRARQVGGKIAMDIHVQVDPELTVRAGHDIAGAVRDRVQRALPTVVEVIVHIEPAEQ